MHLLFSSVMNTEYRVPSIRGAPLSMSFHLFSFCPLIFAFLTPSSSPPYFSRRNTTAKIPSCQSRDDGRESTCRTAGNDNNETIKRGKLAKKCLVGRRFF